MNLKTSLDFLQQLGENNNKGWFYANKDFYNEAKNEFENLINFLIPIIKSIDNEIDVISAKECIFRIFRDVRFSKIKLPYKINFGGFISKGGRKSHYAGFYLHIEPNNSFVGGGAYMPEPRYLKAIRTEIFEETNEYKSIINNPDFKKYFKEIYGEKLKTFPRDFPKTFLDIDLIRNKHYTVSHKVDDTFWIKENLVDNLYEIFGAQLSFNKFLNRAIDNVLNY